MGKKTIELHHVSKSYEGRKIVEDFDYIFLKNQTVAFVGSNGCGKSTLLKMIAGQIPPDEGSVEFGETIKMGYFAQEIPQMDENQRVIDYVKDIAEYIPTRDGADYGIPDAGAFSVYAGHAVCAHWKAFRRREEAALSAWSAAAGTQCAGYG